MRNKKWAKLSNPLFLNYPGVDAVVVDVDAVAVVVDVEVETVVEVDAVVVAAE